MRAGPAAAGLVCKQRARSGPGRVGPRWVVRPRPEVIMQARHCGEASQGKEARMVGETRAGVEGTDKQTERERERGSIRSGRADEVVSRAGDWA